MGGITLGLPGGQIRPSKTHHLAFDRLTGGKGKKVIKKEVVVQPGTYLGKEDLGGTQEKERRDQQKKGGYVRGDQPGKHLMRGI